MARKTGVNRQPRPSRTKRLQQTVKSNAHTGSSQINQSQNKPIKIQTRHITADKLSVLTPTSASSHSTNAIHGTPTGGTSLRSSLPGNPSAGAIVSDIHKNSSTNKKGASTHQAKTLWDWLQLVVSLLGALGTLAIPIVVVFVAAGFSQDLQKAASQNNISIATSQREQTTLDTYLDRMQDLLVNNNLSDPKAPVEFRALARARTLAALSELSDGTRKKIIIQFLYESKLIYISDPIVDLSEADLSHADLHNLNLSKADFNDITFTGANFIGATLTNATFSGSTLTNATFTRANLTRANLTGVKLIGAILTRANLTDANLTGDDLSRHDLTDDTLAGAILTRANLTDANLTGDDLSSTQLDFATLRGATLISTNLDHAALSNATLTNTNLSSANLSAADLAYAFIDQAILSNANFTDATLIYTNMSYSNLTGAIFKSANLMGAIVTKEQLEKAKLFPGTIMPDGSTYS
ncbi:MAG: pentapeptide repeat-containing protein [Ktedonobacteraceae bacterium]